MPDSRTLRFRVLHIFLPLAAFTLLAALFEFPGLDIGLSSPFYQPPAGWIYKDSWWASGLIHEGGRKFILVIALVALAVWALSYLVASLRFLRRAALFLVLSIALGTGIVSLGKHTLNRHCPWDYDVFNGPVPYVRLFETTPPGHEKGNCFPAGHASGGFSLMSTYFIFAGQDRRKALGGLLLGLIMGSLFGFGQVARGAHFVSHNVWTAAICWFTALGLYIGPFKGRLLPRAGAGQG